MADDKNGRDKQAQDAERRQQERAIATELERGDEQEPPIETDERTGLEAALEAVSFPATGTTIVATIGEYEVESAEGSYSIEALLPETDTEQFDSPAAVRVQVAAPTVAAAMKRVVEASKTLPQTEFGWTQRKAYEKTFEELNAIDADDDDDGVRSISDWIVDRIHDTERLPTSRAVRREAAALCRSNGYEVRTDEWLGI
ncbi:hypothetical protein SAMN05192561_10920 [Halopenitus malekzadehii]|uniref:Uncharacterized protein n=1 Tax=Halopenitus malekzadehii TaxID=1267564 RepID=A0A1H6J7U0_9EURY|nr:hypothetical protein [Halopenitus malekzadehii]SEH58099.1 hypothetical protein SAMN05192561_10920 [Halopenitus malekzadehii]